jgi:hypothetical protein
VPLSPCLTKAPPLSIALFELKVVLAIDCFANGAAAAPLLLLVVLMLVADTAPPLAEALLFLKLQLEMSSEPAAATAPPSSARFITEPQTTLVRISYNRFRLLSTDG